MLVFNSTACRCRFDFTRYRWFGRAYQLSRDDHRDLISNRLIDSTPFQLNWLLAVEGTGGKIVISPHTKRTLPVDVEFNVATLLWSFNFDQTRASRLCRGHDEWGCYYFTTVWNFEISGKTDDFWSLAGCFGAFESFNSLVSFTDSENIKESRGSRMELSWSMTYHLGSGLVNWC